MWDQVPNPAGFDAISFRKGQYVVASKWNRPYLSYALFKGEGNNLQQLPCDWNTMASGINHEVIQHLTGWAETMIAYQK